MAEVHYIDFIEETEYPEVKTAKCGFKIDLGNLKTDLDSLVAFLQRNEFITELTITCTLWEMKLDQVEDVEPFCRTVVGDLQKLPKLQELDFKVINKGDWNREYHERCRISNEKWVYTEFNRGRVEKRQAPIDSKGNAPSGKRVKVASVGVEIPVLSRPVSSLLVTPAIPPQEEEEDEDKDAEEEEEEENEDKDEDEDEEEDEDKESESDEEDDEK